MFEEEGKKLVYNFLPKIEQSFSFGSCNKSLEKQFLLCVYHVFSGLSFNLKLCSQNAQRNVFGRFHFDLFIYCCLIQYHTCSSKTKNTQIFKRTNNVEQ